MVLYLSPNRSKFPHVHRTLLSILADLTNAFTQFVILLLLFTPLEFFTLAFADGLSLEFERQQVSSSLQDSSQYSGRSQ